MRFRTSKLRQLEIAIHFFARIKLHRESLRRDREFTLRLVIQAASRQDHRAGRPKKYVCDSTEETRREYL